MTKERNPILTHAYLPYELEQFIRLEGWNNNILFENILARYAILGLSLEEKNFVIRDFPRNPPSKSVAIPARLHDFIMKKARKDNVHYNNILVEYLILGVKSVNTEDSLLINWIKELNKYLKEMKKNKS